MPGFECSGDEARQWTIQVARTVRKGLIASTGQCAGGSLFIWRKRRLSRITRF